MLTLTNIHGVIGLFDQADFVISILDEDSREARNFKLRGPRNSHFIARFEDTEHPSEKEWVRMQREVSGILRWVRDQKITRDHNLVVHCHAGRSRSSAVSWIILKMFGMGTVEAFQFLWKQNSQIDPNQQVLAIGAKILNFESDFMIQVQRIAGEISMRRSETGYM